MIEQLCNILYTLNKIDVHGKQNLDMLLGCIAALENMQVELKAKEVNTDG